MDGNFILADTCFDFADKASEAGVLVILRLWNNGYDEGRNTDILERLRERFADGEWTRGKRGYRIRHRLHLEYGERFEWPDETAEDIGDHHSCYGLRDQVGVLCDGSVVPCCLDADGAITLGNIFTDELSDILSTPRAVALKRSFEQKRVCEELCRRCGFAKRFK